jgi:plasmid stabilization system protein ParE
VNDLEAIAEYIGRDSRKYAASTVKRVRNSVRRLEEWPMIGRMVPEFDDPRLREVIVGNYRVIYSPQQDEIAVLAVIHGARDLPAVWRREARGNE